MSKKKKKKIIDATLQEDQVVLHGSANGWLKIRDHEGVETMLIPAYQTPNDEPANFVFIGIFTVDSLEEEITNGEGGKDA